MILVLCACWDSGVHLRGAGTIARVTVMSNLHSSEKKKKKKKKQRKETLLQVYALKGTNLLPWSKLFLILEEASSQKKATVSLIIKALTALVGRFTLSVGWENGRKRRRKTVSFNP